MGQERIAAVDLANMTPEQKAAAKSLTSGPRGAVRGPFAVLLNNPGTFVAVQNLGSHLRFESDLPGNLRELAILVTAQHWQQEYEWSVHAEIAGKFGLSKVAIEKIRMGTSPETLSLDEGAVFAFCKELHISRNVSDQVFSKIKELLSDNAIIELCVICGYYATLAMIMNVARNPVPSSHSPFAHDR